MAEVFSVFYEKDFLVQLSKSVYTYRGLELNFIGNNPVVKSNRNHNRRRNKKNFGNKK
jgi:hypothetical protein